jgi:hypothetical protein
MSTRLHPAVQSRPGQKKGQPSAIAPSWPVRSQRIGYAVKGLDLRASSADDGSAARKTFGYWFRVKKPAPGGTNFGRNLSKTPLPQGPKIRNIGSATDSASTH